MLLIPESKRVVWVADKKVIVSGQRKIINFYEYLVDTPKVEQHTKNI